MMKRDKVVEKEVSALVEVATRMKACDGETLKWILRPALNGISEFDSLNMDLKTKERYDALHTLLYYLYDGKYEIIDAFGEDTISQFAIGNIDWLM